ncbi:hypothetical protein [Dyella sp.]|jgi:hypothetical protein|uniref:hypothetical protein n=1 Tax=Dyella sp. TaxID=1869338 RepID=UPI002D790FC1|nr:hypothetical protein [Dyella sp.]HET6433128.1 hypothetical protein [Dyella sp.]
MTTPPRDVRKTGYPSMDEDEQSRASGDGNDFDQGSRTPRNKHERSGKQSDFEKRHEGTTEVPHG